MSKKLHCLNCNEILTGKFCSNCGQKADTNRITLKHFLFHNLLHGVWHFEKGIFFTLKEALVRPGQAALDYISGKRVRYYNVFYLSLLMIGLQLLLIHLYSEFGEEVLINSDENNRLNISNFFKDHLKIILFSIIPLLALNAFLVFRRLKLNLAEHLIIAGITLLGMIEITILFSFTDFINQKYSFVLFGIIEVVFFFSIVLFPIWSYANALKNVYAFWSKTWRIALFYLLVYLQFVFLFFIIIRRVTNVNDGFYIHL